MTRVPVNPELLRWARKRSGLAPEALATKFRNLPEGEDGETHSLNTKSSRPFSIHVAR